MGADTVPKVSVIIPVYNMATQLHSALYSVRDQTYGNIEIIVADDGSEDNIGAVQHLFSSSVFDVLKGGPTLRWFSQPNAGRSAAINRAFQNYEGEYLVLLDADDALPPDSLEKRVDFLKKNPEFDAVFGDTEYTKCSEVYSIRKLKMTDSMDLLWFLSSPKVRFPLPALMYRAEAVSKIGNFDESLRRAQDFDYVARLLAECNVGYTPSVVYTYCVESHPSLKRIKNRIRSIISKQKTIWRHAPGFSGLYLHPMHLLADSGKLLVECFTSKK